MPMKVFWHLAVNVRGLLAVAGAECKTETPPPPPSSMVGTDRGGLAHWPGSSSSWKIDKEKAQGCIYISDRTEIQNEPRRARNCIFIRTGFTVRHGSCFVLIIKLLEFGSQRQSFHPWPCLLASTYRIRIQEG